ncbi:dTDP-4-dehydrorhamnose reductase [Leeia oryzae]|uniref:dTDP-4-dehydrorhamnose reductase n=1 Tax=Leeia oryzae TaxID=356662 RepID=UPI00037C8FF7|nr:dTDP-4-dehydrorhamnose reductase [Leeia oryzae]
MANNMPVSPVRLLILGANGQVGFELQRALSLLGEVIAADRSIVDLSDPARIRAYVREVLPAVIVNAAAYTAVDKAETDSAMARAINADAVGALASVASELGCLLVHYSTDYVFDGSKAEAYQETDTPAPINVYGQTKLAGEQLIQQQCARHLVFRTTWVYGVHGGNFVKTMLRLAKDRDSLNVVNDQFGAPTSAALIADVTASVIKQYLVSDPMHFPYGIYHLAAAGETNWHAYASFAIGLARQLGMPLTLDPVNIQAIPGSAYPVPAARPANSRLDCRKLQQTFGITLPSWQQHVQQTVQLITELSR